MADSAVSGSPAPAPAPAPPPAKDRVSALAAFLRPLRGRRFRLLVAGQTLSTFGDFLFIVAFPFLVFAGRVGVGGLGVVLTLLGISRLVATPVGGMLADRWHPRVTMITADLGRAAVLIWLADTIGAGKVPLWQFGIVALVLGALEGLFIPAYRAITPAVLPEEHVRAGYSVGEALNVAAAIAGQLVAGLALTAFGPATVISIDVGTFAVSAVTLAAMGGSRAWRQAGAGRAAGEAEPAAMTLRGFIIRSRLFLVILVMTGMVSVTAAGLFAVGLPVLAKESFPRGAEVYGMLLVAIAIGRLAGSLAAGVLIGTRKRGLIALALLVVHGAVLAAVPVLGGLPALLPALAILGLADGTLAVVVVTLTQQLAPPEILGRAMGALTLVQTGSFPVSVALAGLLVGSLGVTTVFVAGGVGVLVVALLGSTQRVVRDA
jgi:DHA3 family tetracycline resistance protein-like MFS transporter